MESLIIVKLDNSYDFHNSTQIIDKHISCKNCRHIIDLEIIYDINDKVNENNMKYKNNIYTKEISCTNCKKISCTIGCKKIVKIIVKEKQKRHNNNWTYEEEIKLCEELINKKKNINKIANIFSRTNKSIQRKFEKLRYYFDNYVKNNNIESDINK